LWNLNKLYTKKDWLVKKKEDGQTFIEFVTFKNRNKVSKKNVIYIMCMDNDISENSLEKLQKY